MSEDKKTPKGPMQAVGYCSPPSEHRFRKGKSGNPNGRPRKVKGEGKSGSTLSPTFQIIREEMDRKITIREGNKLHDISTYRAIVRTTFRSALKGNSGAQKWTVDAVRLVANEEKASRDAGLAPYVPLTLADFYAAANGDTEECSNQSPDADKA